MWYFLAQSWTFWLGLILGIVIILWIFWGGKKYDFIGLPKFSKSEKKGNRYDRYGSKKDKEEIEDFTTIIDEESDSYEESYTDIKSLYEPDSEDSDYIRSVYQKTHRYHRKNNNERKNERKNDERTNTERKNNERKNNERKNNERTNNEKKNNERKNNERKNYRSICPIIDRKRLLKYNKDPVTPITPYTNQKGLDQKDDNSVNMTEENIYPVKNNLNKNIKTNINKKFKIMENDENNDQLKEKSVITLINNTPKIPRGVIGDEQPLNVKDTNKFNCSKGEQLCKEALESIYNLPFSRVRPDFLKNPETGRNLELDCYNDQIKIACEYNGEQHYIFPNRFHKNVDEFIAQVRRDNFKVDTCDNNGIYLITVPYNVPHYLIKNYIQYYSPENVASRDQN